MKAISAASGQVARIIVDGESGRILNVNSATRRILGYENGALVGEPFSVLFPPDSEISSSDLITKLRNHDTVFQTWTVLRADGALRPVDLTSTLIPWAGSEAILATFRVANAHDQEQMVRGESERLLRDVFDGIQDGISVLDRELNVVRVNRWMEKKYADQMPLVGKKCYQIYQRRESLCPWCPSLETLTTGEPCSETVPYPSEENPDGWIDLFTFPLKDAQGQVIGVIEHVRDVTKRMRTEEALRRYAERLKALHRIDRAILAAQSPEAISRATLEHLLRLVACQRVSVVLLNQQADQAVVLNAYINEQGQVATETKIPGNSFDVKAALHQGPARIVEDVRALADPPALMRELEAKDIRSYLTVPLIVKGQLVGSLFLGAEDPGSFAPEHIEIVREVGDQLAVAIQQARLDEQVQRYTDQLERQVIQRTAELKAALDQAESANRLKSEFVSDVSHELRTPLANLKLYTSLLTRGPTERKPDYLDTLHREVERLQNLVEKLLDLSRLDSDKTPLNLQPTDLNRLIRTLSADREALIADRGLDLELDPAEDLSLTLVDPKLIEQVLTNLLTNAVNYTPAGGRITLRTRPVTTEGGQWNTIEVVDTGPGIAKEEQVHLFERFYRGRAGRASDAPGTGLGLNICKEIVERHQGRIRVQSELGEGSTFTVWLPTSSYVKD